MSIYCGMRCVETKNPTLSAINVIYLLYSSDNFLRVKIFYDELNLEKVVQSTYYDVSFYLPFTLYRGVATGGM